MNKFENESNERNELLEYALTLPGAEKASKENPIVRIEGKVIDGKLVQRAVTKDDAWNQMISGILEVIDELQEKCDSKEKSSRR